MSIHENDAEREQFLDVRGQVVAQLNGRSHAYGVTSGHYRWVFTMTDEDLFTGMHPLNGVFT